MRGDTLAIGAPARWFRLGSWHEDVARRGEEAGLNVVMDRCVKIEHAHFRGGLHLAGFATGVISSRRALEREPSQCGPQSDHKPPQQ